MERIMETIEQTHESNLIKKIVYSEWAQIIVFTITIFGLFLWSRSESRADFRHLDEKYESHRIEMIALMKSIQDEIKDFHGRLCTIEERNKK